MANKINIEFISSYNNVGVTQAINDMKRVESEYTRVTGKTMNTPVNLTQFSKNLRSLLNNPELAKFGQEYANNFITSFQKSFAGSGASFEKIKAQYGKILSEIWSIDPTLKEKSEQQIKEILDTIDTGMDSTSKKASKFAGIIGKAFSFALVMKGFQKLKQLLSESSKLAGEAEQKFSKLNTVFNELPSAMQSATKLAKDLGVAVSTSANALSTVGDLLQGQGATTSESLKLAKEWVSQFNDIIAFKDINKSLEEFAQSFMSGAMGNTENFKTFGSVVKETAVSAELARKNMTGLTGSALEYQKMIIRANLALDQQKNAIGATAREWDTVQSINRRLNQAVIEYKELLGVQVNESLKGIKQWWTEILEETNRATRASKQYQEYLETGNVSAMTGLYDPKNNQKDFDALVKKLKETAIYENKHFMGSALYGTTNNKRLLEIAGQYNADPETFRNAMKIAGAKAESDVVTPEKYAKYGIVNFDEVLQKQYGKIVGDKAKDTKQEELYNALEESTSVYSQFLETLNTSVKGVLVTNTSLDNAENALQGDKKYLTNTVVTQYSDEFISQPMKDLASALEQVNNATAETFGKTFELKTGSYSDVDLINDKIDRLNSLYTVANNQFISNGGGIDEQEKAFLNLIIDTVNTYNDQIKELNATDTTTTETETVEKDTSDFDNALDGLTEIITTNNDRLTQLSLMSAGMSEEQSSKQMELNKAIEIATEQFNKVATMSENGEMVAKIGDSFYTLNSVVEKVSENFKDLDESTYKAFDYFNNLGTTYNAKQEKQALMDTGLSEKDADSQIALNKAIENAKAQFEKVAITDPNGVKYASVNGEFKTLEQVLEMVVYNLKGFDVAITDTDNAVEQVTQAVEETEKAIEKFSLPSNLAGFVNYTNTDSEGNYVSTNYGNILPNIVANAFDQTEIGDLFSTFAEGFEDGGVIGGIVETVASILNKLDGWDNFVELGEEFVQNFANTFEPLMPMLTMMANTVNSVLTPIFKLVFPLIKLISMIVIASEGLLGEIYGVICDILEAVTFGFVDLSNPIRQALNSTADDFGVSRGNDSWDTAMNLLDYVGNMTYQTAQNTSETDDDRLDAYREMYEAGLITLDEMHSLWGNLQNVQYDTVGTTSLGQSYQNTVGGQTIVYNGDMQIKIDGTNLSAEEVAQAVMRELSSQNRAGSQTSWTA